MKQTIFPETGDNNLKEFKIKYLFYDFFLKKKFSVEGEKRRIISLFILRADEID